MVVVEVDALRLDIVRVVLVRNSLLVDLDVFTVGHFLLLLNLADIFVILLTELLELVLGSLRHSSEGLTVLVLSQL